MTRPSAAPTNSAMITRLALVHAALKLFGSRGFDGTSTRDIATLANANIGSIAYHFGSKHGLRLAAADHIVRTIQTVAGPIIEVAPSGSRLLGREEARAQLFGGLERMVNFIVAAPEAGDVVQFMLRELSTPTEALDQIYDGVFKPVHKNLCTLWELATGEPAELESTKLSVFTFIGQVIYFRIGREVVRRRMGWVEIGVAEAAAVFAITRRNLEAILDVSKGDTFTSP